MNDTTPNMEGTPLIAPSSTDHPLYDTLVEPVARSMIPKYPLISSISV